MISKTPSNTEAKASTARQRLVRETEPSGMHETPNTPNRQKNTSRSFNFVSVQELPYDLVVGVLGHGDDFGISLGGTASTLRRRRGDVRVCSVTTMPGYNGVEDQWLDRHLSEAWASLAAMLRVESPAGKIDPQHIVSLARDRLGPEINAYGATEDQRIRNLLKTATRCDEGRREADALGLYPGDYRFLGLARSYAEKRPVGEDIRRCRQALQDLAQGARKRLLITHHPNDTNDSHALCTEICLRAIGGDEWDIAYGQSPWFDLPKPSLVLPLTHAAMGMKLDALDEHSSQTERTPYAELAESMAKKNALSLPEMIAGFGSNSQSLGLGKYCETFLFRRFSVRYLEPEMVNIVDILAARVPEWSAGRVAPPAEQVTGRPGHAHSNGNGPLRRAKPR